MFWGLIFWIVVLCYAATSHFCDKLNVEDSSGVEISNCLGIT